MQKRRTDDCKKSFSRPSKSRRSVTYTPLGVWTAVTTTKSHNVDVHTRVLYP